MIDQPNNLDAIDLSDEKLKRLAGSGAFHRGYDYYKQDLQLVYQVKGSKVTANVSGTRQYKQQLTFSLQGLEGHCSCPASDNIDFCKHCVAVALAVRETQTLDPLAQKEKAPRVSARQKELDLIKTYLEKLERSELETHLLSLINADKIEFGQWALRAHNALNSTDAKFLKKKITQAFPINKHLHRYSQVAQYFAQAEPIVDLLMQQHEGLSAKDLFTLADYALSRLGKALLTVDDSGGYRFHCEDTLSKLFIKAVEAKQFKQDELISFLLTKFQENNEISPDIPESFQHLLGDDGVEAFYQALLQQWRNMPVPKASDAWDDNGEYLHYFYQLLSYARDAQKQDLLIELHQRNARSASDLADLVELLIAADEWDRAEMTLKRAQKTKNSHYVANQLLRAEVKILVQQDKHSSAFQILVQNFNATPSFLLYKNIQLFIQQHNQYGFSFDYQDVIDQLRKRLSQDALNQFIFGRLILDILFFHQRYPEILAIEAQEKLPKEYLSRLIEVHPGAPEITLPLYAKLADCYVRFTDNEHYQHAVGLLVNAEKLCESTKTKADFKALLIELTTTHKAKRNFIKYLNQSLSHWLEPK